MRRSACPAEIAIKATKTPLASGTARGSAPTSGQGGEARQHRIRDRLATAGGSAERDEMVCPDRGQIASQVHSRAVRQCAVHSPQLPVHAGEERRSSMALQQDQGAARFAHDVYGGRAKRVLSVSACPAGLPVRRRGGARCRRLNESSGNGQRARATGDPAALRRIAGDGGRAAAGYAEPARSRARLRG